MMIFNGNLQTSVGPRIRMQLADSCIALDVMADLIACLIVDLITDQIAWRL